MVTSIAGAWRLSGFLKDIQLRHPHVYERLGSPSPQRTSESDVHAFALLRFLLSNEYKNLGDQKLLAPARLMKAGMAVSSIAVAVVLVALLFSPSVQRLASLACLRAS